MLELLGYYGGPIGLNYGNISPWTMIEESKKCIISEVQPNKTPDWSNIENNNNQEYFKIIGNWVILKGRHIVKPIDRNMNT